MGQNPRFAAQIGKLEAAGTRPFAFAGGHHHDLIVVHDIRLQIMLGEIRWDASNKQINAALPQFAIIQRADNSLGNVKVNPGIFAREPFDDSRQQAGRDAFCAADAQFSCGRVSEKFELCHALFELVKNHQAALDERLAIGRWFNAVTTAVQQTKPHRVLHIGNRF